MKSISLIIAFGLLAFFLASPSFSAKKKAAKPVTKKSVIRVQKKPEREDIILSAETLFRYGKTAAACKVRSRMPQIDILNAIYRDHKDDADLISGKTRLVIRGEDFSRAFAQIEPLFNRENGAGDDGVFQSKVAPAEIKYRNFKNIVLYCRKGEHRISIELNTPYTQELPYTFGAKIKLAQNIEGTLRSNNNATVTEIVFDNDRLVFFIAPGIAFFLPDVYSRIARITTEDGQLYGSVIGRPESAPKRHVTVKYNLTTCSKSSIKTEELSPREYSRKLAHLN